MAGRRSKLHQHTEVILEWVREHGTDWKGLAPHLGVRPATLQVFWHRNFERAKEGQEALKTYDENSLVEFIDNRSRVEVFADRIFKHIAKNPSTLLDLCDKFEQPPSAVRAAIAILESRGTPINLVDSGTVLHTSKVAPPPESLDRRAIEWSGNKLRFGSVSDTHYGSKYAAETATAQLFHEFERRGVRTVFHSGDMHDGEKMYRGHEYEIKVHGADAQVAYAASHYPRVEGIDTYLISGNHDWSFYKQNGTDVCLKLSDVREDIKYLGPIGRYVDMVNREDSDLKVRLHLQHPRGAGAYARSYKLQKLAESYPGGEKPHISLVGHRHYQNHLFMRNIHLLQLPCLQWQTPFEKELSLSPVVGGYIFEFEFNDDGSISRIVPELITFYRSELAEELQA